MAGRPMDRPGFPDEAGLPAARPEVTDPRATDGDDRFQPDWDERFTLTVGTRDGDLVGRDDRVLQAAVDYVARMGGGTVRLLPGTFTLRNAVFLPSRLRLVGSGPETLLTRIPSERVKLADDSNWFDQEITLEDGHGFHVGDGVAFLAKNPHHGGATVIKRTLTARSGNRFRLNEGLRENLWLCGEAACASLFPLLTSERTRDVLIQDLALDGNGAQCENFNGNYGGCIFIQDCSRYTFRRVAAGNYNGDGISFQVCHDVQVEECHCHDNAGLGVHPGSGSQRPLIRRCTLERNSIGLFWCWGVKYGLAEENRIIGSRDYGISIGHCDTDNIMRRNEVRDSGKVGILFRNENRGRDFWPNRNLLEHNTVTDTGGPDAAAIEIRGKTRDVRLVGNTLRETRAPQQRVGLRIGADVGGIELEENRIKGFAVPVEDARARTE